MNDFNPYADLPLLGDPARAAELASECFSLLSVPKTQHIGSLKEEVTMLFEMCDLKLSDAKCDEFLTLLKHSKNADLLKNWIVSNHLTLGHRGHRHTQQLQRHSRFSLDRPEMYANLRSKDPDRVSLVNE
jgi:hypothetical protein